MKKKIHTKPVKYLVILMVLFFLICSCKNDYYPKPRGYFRIDLPEKEYVRFDTSFPYSFEYPVYARVVPDKDPKAEPYWINVVFPEFKGNIHISYKKINNNLAEYLEDSRTLVMKHIPKASAISNKTFENSEKKVYGLIYDISGTEAASPYQFYLTDSVDHFIRGALYFNAIPNNDSLAPVIDFIEKDIDRMIETFAWK
jgi:gliding motility-associated lipoprotein GldD